MLSPLLFTLLIHDSKPYFTSNHIIMFADDKTVVGFISNNDEVNYRKEVSLLISWCRDNNVEKTKEMVTDFRRGPNQHSPQTINSSAVERGSFNKFLCAHLRGPFPD